MGSDLLSFQRDDDASGRSGAGWLALAFMSALAASVCCVLPLVLVLAGISGAWLSALPRWAPLSPLLSGVTWLALGVAGWRIYRRAVDCADGQACARPQLQRTLRWLFPPVCMLAAIPLLLSLFADRFYGA